MKKFIEKDDLSYVLNREELLVDMTFFKNDKKIEESYLTIQIPSNLSYQISSILEKSHQMIRRNIQDKYKKIEFELNSANITLSSNFKVFNDSSIEIVSFVHMKIAKEEHIVTEICARINNLYNFDKNNLDIKSLKTYVLKSLKEDDYPNYGLILSILWANSAQNISNGIEFLLCKRTDIIQNSIYKYIYYLEYQTLINSNSYNFMYGVTNENEHILIRPIYIMPNRALIPRKNNNNNKKVSFVNPFQNLFD